MSPVSSAQLLRSLASGIRPGGNAAPTPPAGLAFESLLARARAGELTTGAPVKVTRSAGVNLTDEQLARLSIAADRAEAQGATRALVLIDGMALSLDVGVRTITDAIDMAAPAVHQGFDGVVTVPPAQPSASNALSPMGALASLLSRSSSGLAAPPATPG